MIRSFVVAIGALVVVLAGCTALAQPTSSHDDATEPPPIATQPVEIPDGVVATGALRSVIGRDLGEVQVVKEGNDYRVEIPEHDALDARIEMIVLSDSPFETSECGDANISGSATRRR
jgi:hypothetical protein